MYDPFNVNRIDIDLSSSEPIRFDLSNFDKDWSRSDPFPVIVPDFKPVRLNFFANVPDPIGWQSTGPPQLDFPWYRPGRPQFRQEINSFSSLGLSRLMDLEYLPQDYTHTWKEPQYLRLNSVHFPKEPTNLLFQSEQPSTKPFLFDLAKFEVRIPECDPGYVQLPDVELHFSKRDPITFQLPGFELAYHDNLPRDVSGLLVPPPGYEPGSFLSGYLSAGSTVADYYLAGHHSSDYYQNLNRPLAQRMSPPPVQPYAPISVNPMGSPPPRAAIWGW